MIHLTRLLQSQRGRNLGELIDRLLDHLEYLFVTIFGRDEIARFIFDGNSKSLEAAEHVRSCSEYRRSHYRIQCPQVTIDEFKLRNR